MTVTLLANSKESSSLSSLFSLKFTLEYDLFPSTLMFSSIFEASSTNSSARAILLTFNSPLDSLANLSKVSLAERKFFLASS